MTDDPAGTVTRLLERFGTGDLDAFDEMLPLVYDELRRIAHAQRGRWKGDETMGTTALCHEVYVKLVDQKGASWQTRAHFLHVASRAMRQILIDYARARRALKRGGAEEHLPVEAVEHLIPGLPAMAEARLDTLLDIEAGLERLKEEKGAVYSSIVECRFFGGMTIRETAKALEVSETTVKRGWLAAQAWLYNNLPDDRVAGGEPT